MSITDFWPFAIVICIESIGEPAWLFGDPVQEIRSVNWIIQINHNRLGSCRIGPHRMCCVLGFSQSMIKWRCDDAAAEEGEAIRGRFGWIWNQFG